MRFALLGTHPDGLAMAFALAATGRHELVAYTSPTLDTAIVNQLGSRARAVGDLEEVLADPVIEVVVVGGTPANRPAQLRRSLQSERHVLCVYPPDRTPDAAYEAAMIRADTGCVLLPILPDALHPALRRLADFARNPDSSLGELKLLQVEHAAGGEFLLEPGEIYVKWALPGWDRLRAIGGDITVVSALAPQEDLEPGQTLVISGVFVNGGLFEVTFLADAPQECWRASAIGTRGRVDLLFPLGWQGPSFLTCPEQNGEWREEHFPPWDPWPALVLVFEELVGGKRVAALPDDRITPSPAVVSAQYSVQITPPPSHKAAGLSWQDVIRAQELDTATRRSVAKRRADALEYPDATEESGFKSTMTLVGCGLIWIILLLLVLSAWKPWLGWFILPVLFIFILLQGLRWFARRSPD
jgi:predicted dehydrogenase